MMTKHLVLVEFFIVLTILSNGCHAERRSVVRQQANDISTSLSNMRKQGNVHSGQAYITVNTTEGYRLRAEINFSDNKVNDILLEHLRGLPGITGIDLSRTKITDKGLSVLITLPDLEYVQLGGTSISDEGIKVLAKSPKLSHIDMRNTQVTKAAIPVLSKMKLLRVVYSKGTPISEIKGVEVNSKDDLETYWGDNFKTIYRLK